jgi:hypothetical protein
MTKQSKLVADTIVGAETAAVASAPAATPKPYSVRLIGPTTMMLAQAAALIRSHGYIPDPDTAIEMFPQTGRIAMVLVQGQPEEYAVEAAVTTIAEEAEREQVRFNRLVEEAAARQIEAAARAAAEARRASLLAEQRKQLAALEAEIANA